MFGKPTVEKRWNKQGSQRGIEKLKEKLSKNGSGIFIEYKVKYKNLQKQYKEH